MWTVEPRAAQEGMQEKELMNNAPAPGAADGLADPQPAQDAGELGRSVIASAVGVKHRAGRETEIPRRHPYRCRDQRRPVIVIHRPAGYFPGRAVDHRRENKPSASS